MAVCPCVVLTYIHTLVLTNICTIGASVGLFPCYTFTCVSRISLELYIGIVNVSVSVIIHRTTVPDKY